MKSDVVAIDGFAYVGKSQIAKALAKLTGFPYINTGHMYRSIAKLCMEQNIPVTDLASIRKYARQLDIRFEDGRTIVNREDWTYQFDHVETVLYASKIAGDLEIRKSLTALQQQMVSRQPIIMEGRDIGSVVFPNARWKFFITASIEVRAKRMLKMISREQGAVQDPARLISKVKEIDEADKNRKISPLIEAPGAFIYDNTESPAADEDALVLKHYLDHYDQYGRGNGPVKFTYQEGVAQVGKYIRA